MWQESKKVWGFSSLMPGASWTSDVAPRKRSRLVSVGRWCGVAARQGYYWFEPGASGLESAALPRTRAPRPTPPPQPTDKIATVSFFTCEKITGSSSIWWVCDRECCWLDLSSRVPSDPEGQCSRPSRSHMDVSTMGATCVWNLAL